MTWTYNQYGQIHGKDRSGRRRLLFRADVNLYGEVPDDEIDEIMRLAAAAPRMLMLLVDVCRDYKAQDALDMIAIERLLEELSVQEKT